MGSFTKAGFGENREKIFMRDKYRCIFCKGSYGLQAHHVYYGSEAEYNDTRNNIDRGVTLCCICHTDLHNMKMKGGKYLRDLAKQYLENKEKIGYIKVETKFGVELSNNNFIKIHYGKMD